MAQEGEEAPMSKTKEQVKKQVQEQLEEQGRQFVRRKSTGLRAQLKRKASASSETTGTGFSVLSTVEQEDEAWAQTMTRKRQVKRPATKLRALKSGKISETVVKATSAAAGTSQPSTEQMDGLWFSASQCRRGADQPGDGASRHRPSQARSRHGLRAVTQMVTDEDTDGGREGQRQELVCDADMGESGKRRQQ